MIEILNNIVVVSQDSNKDYSKFLWETIDLMTNRFIIIFISSKKIKVNYEKSFNYKFDNDHVFILQGSSQDEFIKILNFISNNCIHEFYINLNSPLIPLKLILKKC